MTDTTLKPAASGAVRNARIAVSVVFFSHGAVFANWAARIPDVQANIGLSEAQLGLALTGMAVGVLIALPLVGGLIARFGSRSVTVGAGIGHALLLIVPALMNSLWALFAVLIFWGISASMMDVAMNAQGVGVERLLGKPILSGLHAMFSLGLAVGAIMAGWTISGPIVVSFMIAGVLFMSINVGAVFWLLPEVENEKNNDAPSFSLPPRPLWLLGALSFCAAIGEIAMTDWSAKYIRDIVLATPEAAAYGLTAFSLMMTVGRFSGDWLVGRFSRVMIFRMGGLLALAGTLLTVIMPTYAMVLVGLGIAGLGLSTLIPLAFSAAGNTPGVPSGVGIAGVATIGYSGFLFGAPAIGFIAEASSLRMSFAAVAALMLVIVAFSGAVAPPTATES